MDNANKEYCQNEDCKHDRSEHYDKNGAIYCRAIIGASPERTMYLPKSHICQCSGFKPKTRPISQSLS